MNQQQATVVFSLFVAKLRKLTTNGKRSDQDIAEMIVDYTDTLSTKFDARHFGYLSQNGQVVLRDHVAIEVASRHPFWPLPGELYPTLEQFVAERVTAEQKSGAQKSLPPPSSKMETWFAFCDRNNVSGMDKVVGKVLIAKIVEIKDELPNHNKPLPEQKSERAKRIEFHKRLMAQNYVVAYSALVECFPDLSLDREDTSTDWKDRRRLATTLRGIAEPTMHPQATRLLGMVRQAVARVAPENMDMIARYKPLLRPAGFATLPPGLTWRYVEAPTMHGLYVGDDLPRSSHRFGIIETSRALTVDEKEHFDLADAP